MLLEYESRYVCSGSSAQDQNCNQDFSQTVSYPKFAVPFQGHVSVSKTQFLPIVGQFPSWLAVRSSFLKAIHGSFHMALS